MRLGLHASLVFGLVSLACIGRASAQASPDEAEQLITQGVALRQHGDDAGALVQFRHAYELSHGARALAQVALAEQALGQWTDAERDLSQALERTDDAWITRNRGVLEGALTVVRSNLGSLTVMANVAGAELWVNGSRVATLPMASPVRVPLGSVTVELRKAGYLPAQRVISIAAGSLHRESMVIVPREQTTDQATAPTPVVQSPPPPIQRAGSRTATITMPPTSAPSESGQTRRTAGMALAGAGVVLLLAGLGTDAYWQQRVGVYNDNTECDYGTLTRSQRCGAILSEANAGEPAMIALLSVGALAAIVGGILWLTSPSPRSEQAASANVRPSHRGREWTCAVAFSGWGATCQVPFN